MIGAATAGKTAPRKEDAKETLMSGHDQRAQVLPVAPEPTGSGSHRSVAQVVKDIALFFAGPFITIAYLALFPFIAVRMLRQARRDRKTAAKA
jgi:hypothetical protein